MNIIVGFVLWLLMGMTTIAYLEMGYYKGQLVQWIMEMPVVRKDFRITVAVLLFPVIIVLHIRNQLQ